MDKLKNLIALGVYENSDMLLIPEESTGGRPQSPFATYKISTIAKGMGDRITKYKEAGEEFKRTDSVTLNTTLSINVYGDEEKALQVYDYFKLFGLDTLRTEGYVIESIQGFGNRDFLQTDKIVNRIGFDVIIRSEHTIEQVTEWIESYTITEKQEG